MYSSLTKFIYVTTVFAMGYVTGKRFSQKQYYCIIMVPTPGLISPVFVSLTEVGITAFAFRTSFACCSDVCPCSIAY